MVALPPFFIGTAWKMIKIACLSLLVVAGLVAVAEARYCHSPWCAMCARMFGPMDGYQLVEGDGWGRVVRSPEPRQPAAPVVDATPHEVVRAMLSAIKPQPADVLYDLGCGDGRVMIEAIRGYGCQAVGIEIDPMLAERARQNLTSAGIPKRWRVVLGDARNFLYPQATVVFLYQHPDLMAELLPKLTSARVIASYSHELTDRPSELRMAGEHPFYVWTKQAAEPFASWPTIQPAFPFLTGGISCPQNLPH